MKHTLVMLAVLPLAFSVGGCGAPPEAGEVGAGANGSLSLSQLPPPRQMPFPTAALIDFDSSAAGPVADGTMVDSTYAPSGVTLSCVACASGHAYALLSAVGNNAVSLFAPPSYPEFDARWGAVKAAFAAPRSWVSIEVTAVLPPEFKGTPVARPFLEAFDAQDNLIGSVVYYPFSYGTAGFGTTQTLTVSSAAVNIAYVLFSSQAPGATPPVYGLFDNLRYNVPRFVFQP